MLKPQAQADGRRWCSSIHYRLDASVGVVRGRQSVVLDAHRAGRAKGLERRIQTTATAFSHGNLSSATPTANGFTHSNYKPY